MVEDDEATQLGRRGASGGRRFPGRGPRGLSTLQMLLQKVTHVTVYEDECPQKCVTFIRTFSNASRKRSISDQKVLWCTKHLQ